jgi:hypothetical protein
MASDSGRYGRDRPGNGQRDAAAERGHSQFELGSLRATRLKDSGEVGFRLHSLERLTAKQNSLVLSVRRLDPSPTRPSNIIATNSETVGSQSHSLRQPFRDQHSPLACERLWQPNNRGLRWTDLRTASFCLSPEIFSLGLFVSRAPHFADLVRIS